MVVGSLVASFVLGALLSIHAGIVGRRQGRRVASLVTEAVERTVTDAAFAPIDRLDDARLRLHEALVRIRRTTRQTG
jgi:hypothetical protein